MTVWVKCGDGRIKLAPYKGAVRGYEVVGCERLVESCIIPDNYRGKPIVSIDSIAFDGAYIIKELFIPDSVRYIYDGAFEEMPSLERVRVPLGTSKDTVARLFSDESTAVFYGTSGLCEEDIPDDGGKMLVDDDYTEAVSEASHDITILNPRADKNKVGENKGRFRFMQAVKTAAFFLPTLVGAIIPFDIFGARTGHYLNIVAEGSIGLGWAITLYVIYCIAALLVGICFTYQMFGREKYIDRHTVRNTKTYNKAAAIVSSASAIIVALNLAYILPNIGKDKITFAGGNVNEIVYLHTSEEIELPTPTRDNDEYEDYYTTYTFRYWKIDGRHYMAGAIYNPTGWERAEAVFEAADYATLYISTDSAQIRVDYDSFTETKTSGELAIRLGTEVTLTASFSYNNVKELYINSKEVSNPYIFTMEKHTSAYAKSISDGCFAEGTLVTLADGSVKAVEDLVVGDELLVFNHITGKLDTAPMFINAHALGEAEEYEVITLAFSGGESLKIVDEHAVYDITDGKYAYINRNNAHSLIGHTFAAVSGGEVSETTLTGVDIERRTTKIYNPVSSEHVNLIAGGVLTNSACTVDMFEYDEDMRYDEAAMARDIAEYGLYGYEVFEDYISFATYEAFPLRYYKVAVEKGLCTFDDVMVLIRHYLNDTTAK